MEVTEDYSVSWIAKTQDSSAHPEPKILPAYLEEDTSTPMFSSKEVKENCVFDKDDNTNVESTEDSEEPTPAGLSEFPAELILEIFKHMDISTLGNARAVCRSWYSISKSKNLRKTVVVSVKKLPQRYDRVLWYSYALSSDCEHLIFRGSRGPNCQPTEFPDFSIESSELRYWLSAHYRNISRLTFCNMKIADYEDGRFLNCIKGHSRVKTVKFMNVCLKLRCFIVAERTWRFDSVVIPSVEFELANTTTTKGVNPLWIDAIMDANAEPVSDEDEDRIIQALASASDVMISRTRQMLFRHEPKFEKIYGERIARVWSVNEWELWGARIFDGMDVITKVMLNNFRPWTRHKLRRMLLDNL